MEIDPRAFIASLGGAAAVGLMDSEAEADAFDRWMEEHLDEQVAAAQGTQQKFPSAAEAVVPLAFKVTPAFRETIVKKPVLMDATGKPFNTPVAIVDPGPVPDYKCSFPFRVPAGTKVASVQLDTATIDIAALDRK